MSMCYLILSCLFIQKICSSFFILYFPAWRCIQSFWPHTQGLGCPTSTRICVCGIWRCSRCGRCCKSIGWDVWFGFFPSNLWLQNIRFLLPYISCSLFFRRICGVRARVEISHGRRRNGGYGGGGGGGGGGYYEGGRRRSRYTSLIYSSLFFSYYLYM